MSFLPTSLLLALIQRSFRGLPERDSKTFRDSVQSYTLFLTGISWIFETCITQKPVGSQRQKFVLRLLLEAAPQLYVNITWNIKNQSWLTDVVFSRIWLSSNKSCFSICWMFNFLSSVLDYNLFLLLFLTLFSFM